jgi:hypothetical protein
MSPEEIDAAVAAALQAANGDVQEAAKALVAENYSLSQDRDTLKAETKALQDVTEYKQFKALGLTSENVGKLKSERDELAKQTAGYERASQRDAAAAAAGVSAKVLARLDEPNLTFLVKDGKAMIQDGTAEPVAFDVYARKHWPEWIPALRPGATTRQPATPSRDDRHHANGHGHRNGTLPPPPDPGTTHLNRVRNSF